MQWFSIDFMFIEKCSFGCLGIAFWCRFERSLVCLGSLFGAFEGIGMLLNIYQKCDFRGGDQDLREYTQWRVKMLVQGAEKLTNFLAVRIQATMLLDVRSQIRGFKKMPL